MLKAVVFIVIVGYASAFSLGGAIVDMAGKGIKLGLKLNPVTAPLVGVYDVLDNTGVLSSMKSMAGVVLENMPGVMGSMIVAVKNMNNELNTKLNDFASGSGMGFIGPILDTFNVVINTFLNVFDDLVNAITGSFNFILGITKNEDPDFLAKFENEFSELSNNVVILTTTSVEQLENLNNQRKMFQDDAEGDAKTIKDKLDEEFNKVYWKFRLQMEETQENVRVMQDEINAKIPELEDNLKDDYQDAVYQIQSFMEEMDTLLQSIKEMSQ